MKSAAKAIQKGCIAWVSFIKPTSASAIAMEARATDSQNYSQSDDRCSHICTEFADIFETPGAAPDR